MVRTMVMPRVLKEDKNDAGKLTYRLLSNGHWEAWEYNDKGLEVRHIYPTYWVVFEYDDKDRVVRTSRSTGSWMKCKYNAQGLKTYEETSSGNWSKFEYDDNGVLINTTHSPRNAK